jgi:hypothetical protein
VACPGTGGSDVANIIKRTAQRLADRLDGEADAQRAQPLDELGEVLRKVP